MICGVREQERYKYLEYKQIRGTDHKNAKQLSTFKYLEIVRAVLRAQLSARNKTNVINTYAGSAITYNFGIIKWTDT